MNSCEWSNYLSDYLDRQLNKKQEEKVNKHLSHCLDCAKEVEELTLIRQIISNLPEEKPPPDLHRRIILHVKRENKSSSKTALIRRIAPLVATIFLFLIGKGIYNITVGTGEYMQNSGGQESVVTAEPESFVDATTDEASTNEVDTAWDHQGLPESAAEVTADQEEPLAVPNSDDSTLEDIDNFYREGDALVENDVGGAIGSPDMPEPDITEKSFLGNHVKFGIGTVLLIALISLFVKAFKFKR